MNDSRKLPSGPLLTLLSLALLAPVWSLGGCTAVERSFGPTVGEGGGSADGGRVDTGPDGGQGGDDGSGGADGGGGSGGQTSTGGGTGGQGEPPTVTCAGTEYPAPEVAGDFGCQTFDEVWPPVAPWSLTDPAARLSLDESLFVSSPSSMSLSVPSSGSPDAKLSWTNTAGDSVAEIRLEFELMQNTLPAAPPAWLEPLSIACLDFGQTEACLLYQWGEGYSLRITDYQTIPDITDCDIAAAPTPGAWEHVVLTFSSVGELVVEIEGDAAATCSGGGAAVGTVALAWVGMEGVSASRQGYSPRMDNVLVRVTRE